MLFQKQRAISECLNYIDANISTTMAFSNETKVEVNVGELIRDEISGMLEQQGFTVDDLGDKRLLIKWSK